MTTAEIATTAEDIEPTITVDDARALTEQIKTSADHLWELLAAAYVNKAWQALGHESWDAYCQFEFGDTRLALPREKRKETVQSLRSAGLTVDAIASATGASTSTVSRDADGVSQPGKPEGKRGPGRPKGSKNKPKQPKEAAPQDIPNGQTGTVVEGELTEFLSVPALPDAGDLDQFKETEAIVAAFGDAELGAVASGGAVMVYHNGYEVDTYTPAKARTLAAALLQAADRAEA